MSMLRIAILVAMATLFALAIACAGAEESGVFYGRSGEPGNPGAPGERGAPGTPGEPGAPGGPGEFSLYAGDDSEGGMVVSTVVAQKIVEKEVVVEREFAVEAMEAKAAPALPAAMTDDVMSMEMAEEASAQNVNISFQPQNRIIVRNADMRVEADDPIATVDDIGDLAVARGGWVVNINTIDEEGFYYITIRIPSETLDEVIEQITANVAKLLSVSSDSTDFTEEYIDLGARRSTVQETVDALTELLRNENYDTVQELLEVQREITNWQSELEIIDGRLAFISESAAYSRLSVTVNRSPIPMRVDVGEDAHIGIGVGRKYTARFFPPDGYDRFEITWDFGDGSEPQTVRSGLRTQGEDGLLSVPVRHTYTSDEFSPHVVTATIRAFSDRGLAEGEDQLWANVSELPRIDAFVTTSEYDVEQGQPATLTASFNHPDSLRNLRYSWNFRDGSPVIEGTVESGETGIEIEHIFNRHRPESYQIVFEIRGDSDAGEVEETHYAHVYVYPGPEIESSDFAPGNTATNAVNVLISVFTFAGTAGIWLAITSPIWIVLGVIIFIIIRFIIRRQRNVARVVFVPNQESKTQVDSQNQPNSEPAN